MGPTITPTPDRPSRNGRRAVLRLMFGLLPWILFSAVVAAGFLGAALVVRLVAASYQNIVRWRAHNLKTLELVTLAFSALDAGATLGLGSGFFRRNGDIALNLTFALMAFGTLAAGSPFTYQYARDDWPHGYWQDPLFRRTNEIITTAWGTSFVLSLASCVVGRNVTSHAFVWTGVAPGILSLATGLFTLWFPKWFTHREMQRQVNSETPYRWAMPACPNDRAEGEYDVIVVGAGIGGLTSASLLAKRGLKVLVLEQCAHPGGYCTSWTRKTPAGSFVFDAGVHEISGLGPRGPVRNLLRRLDAEHAIEWLAVGQQYFLGGTRIRVPAEPNAFGAVLGDLVPEERDGVTLLLEEIRAIYREMYADIELTGGVPCPPRTTEQRLAYPANHPTMVRWMDKPFSELVSTFVRDESLKRVLFALSGYVTDQPSRLTVREMVPIFGYYFDGGFYPKGGSDVLTKTLADVFSREGGTLCTDTPVDAILVEGGHVTGVQTVGGRAYRTSVVISNADARRSLLELVGDRHLPADFTAKLRSLAPSASAFAVFLGVNFVPDLEAVNILSSGISIAIPSKIDPSLAPPGHASITILSFVSADESRTWNRASETYSVRKRQIGDLMIARAEECIPNLRGHIVYRQDASPATFERYTRATQGAIYGFARGPWCPPSRSPIAGLLLAGSGVFPRSGIEAVVISGTLAADAVLAHSHGEPALSHQRRRVAPAVADL